MTNLRIVSGGQTGADQGALRAAPMPETRTAARPWTARERDHLVRLRESGVPLKRCARLLGRSRVACQGQSVRSGLVLQFAKLADGDTLALVRLWRSEGLSLAACARRLRTHKDTLRRWLVRRGEDTSRGPRARSPQRAEALAALAAAGGWETPRGLWELSGRARPLKRFGEMLRRLHAEGLARRKGPNGHYREYRLLPRALRLAAGRGAAG